MTIRRLLAEMDSLELTRWEAYERVYGPLGGLRGDYQAALVASMIANVNRREDAEPMPIDDFLINWQPDDEDDEDQEDEEVDDG